MTSAAGNAADVFVRSSCDCGGGSEPYLRIPGIFRLWELGFVIGPGADYEVRYAETTRDGTPLVMVFQREMRVGHPTEALQ
jgi:hypothetical protein